MSGIDRRALLGRGAALLSLVVFGPLGAGGCTGRHESGGLAAIQWGRENCSQCGMVIGDPRFAARLLGGSPARQWNFDDIGCAATWLARRRWTPARLAVFEVAALDSTGSAPHWLDARGAHYLANHHSPMGYDHGASEQALPGSMDFEAMREAALMRPGGAT